eukprot:CAMPEP_0118942620 /NCGR_PEP_ID=MMETSP1169-20130426/36501_1 /TAXON_ID=36882 /ORGANISM="Pyramimonas obovata, Strain CCMP722" /LENGTH=33 /DNA_ID= /DNA_START= /DNA_END= /DNA_ORIENTATION=
MPLRSQEDNLTPPAFTLTPKTRAQYQAEQRPKR